MQPKITLSVRNFLRYTLLSLPLFLFTFCQSLGEDIVFIKQGGITKDSKIVSLMIEAVSDTNEVSTKSDGDDEELQCTNFRYPMTLEVFPGDDIESIELVINNDEELIDFLTTLTTTYEFYVNWPLTLVDVDGVETNIYGLEELEGTLEIIVEACNDQDGDDDSDGDDDGDDSDDDSNGDDDGDDNEYDFCHDNNKKVYICHKGNTICVSINAIWGHLAHHSEDYLGQCN